MEVSCYQARGLIERTLYQSAQIPLLRACAPVCALFSLNFWSSFHVKGEWIIRDEQKLLADGQL